MLSSIVEGTSQTSLEETNHLRLRTFRLQTHNPQCRGTVYVYRPAFAEQPGRTCHQARRSCSPLNDRPAQIRDAGPHLGDGPYVFDPGVPSVARNTTSTTAARCQSMDSEIDMDNAPELRSPTQRCGPALDVLDATTDESQ